MCSAQISGDAYTSSDFGAASAWVASAAAEATALDTMDDTAALIAASESASSSSGAVAQQSFAVGESVRIARCGASDERGVVVEALTNETYKVRVDSQADAQFCLALQLHKIAENGDTSAGVSEKVEEASRGEHERACALEGAGNDATDKGASEAAYVCELGVDGDIQLATVNVKHLVRLPGKPSNSPVGSVHLPPAGGVRTPWRVGTLVRLVGRGMGRNSLPTLGQTVSILDKGRATASVGCIASVNHDDKTVCVCVAKSTECTLEEGEGAKIGDTVRLATNYASVQDAVQGPLLPGQTATVVACQDGLVLVKYVQTGAAPVATSPVTACPNPECGSEPVQWWYDPAALVLVQWESTVLKTSCAHAVAESCALSRMVSVGGGVHEHDFDCCSDPLGTLIMRVCCGQAGSRLKVACEDIHAAGNRSDCGVFFDVCNTGRRSVVITEIVAGAYTSGSSKRTATLYACTQVSAACSAP